jgi:hypothetical protein
MTVTRAAALIERKKFPNRRIFCQERYELANAAEGIHEDRFAYAELLSDPNHAARPRLLISRARRPKTARNCAGYRTRRDMAQARPGPAPGAEAKAIVTPGHRSASSTL